MNELKKYQKVELFEFGIGKAIYGGKFGEFERFYDRLIDGKTISFTDLPVKRINIVGNQILRVGREPVEGKLGFIRKKDPLYNELNLALIAITN